MKHHSQTCRIARICVTEMPISSVKSRSCQPNCMVRLHIDAGNCKQALEVETKTLADSHQRHEAPFANMSHRADLRHRNADFVSKKPQLPTKLRVCLVPVAS